MEELNRLSPLEYTRSGKFPFVFVLDSIRSLNNVGSVFRTADAFCFEAVYLCGFTGQPPHRDIAKTSLGATETVSWCYFQSIHDSLISLRNEGFTIVGLEQTTGSRPLQHLEPALDQKVAVVLGNEVTGISEEALALCDEVYEIPQFGTKHSLNVSVAAGIAGWQLVSHLHRLQQNESKN